MQNQLLFFNMGGGEIFLIFLVVLLFFGSNKIPEFARSLGKGIRQFKDATQEIQRDIESSVKDVKNVKNDVTSTVTKAVTEPTISENKKDEENKSQN